MATLLRLKDIANIFFQNGCIVCGRTTNKFICDRCESEIEYINPPLCTRCGRPFNSEQGISHLCYNCIKEKNKFTMSRAVFKYNGHIKHLIHRFKFGDQVNLAEFFSDQLIRLYNMYFVTRKIHAIIPVPLANGRLKHRSYNQTQLLADMMSKKLFLPVYSEQLVKVKETLPQSKLNSEQRRENVKHAYMVVDSNRIKSKNILLIDDVITTGATINACANTLIRAGINQVYVIAIAMNV